MTHPSADSIVLRRIDRQHSPTDFLYELQVIANGAVIEILIGIRRDEPYCALKKCAIGTFDSAGFFPGHGMAGEKSRADISAENILRASHNFRLRRANIRNQRTGRSEWANAFDQVNDAPDWS